jgi:alpha-L-rhamnosidase
MKKSGERALFAWLVVFFCVQGAYAVDVADIRCDFKQNPVGVGPRPQYSWVLTSAIRNQFQSGYRILVADSPDLLQNDMGNCWDSGQVKSGTYWFQIDS